MKVKDLIAQLQNMDPEVQVVVSTKYGARPAGFLEAGIYDSTGEDFQPPEAWVNPPPVNAVCIN